MAFCALFDACVLYPASLRDLLLSLAATDLFRARWTDRIQDEWIAALVASKPHLEPSLQRTRQLMEQAVPDATVTGYEDLVGSLALPDADDRHVLAAAIVGRADVIVTLNLKDFPRPVLVPYRIEAQHPDDFVARVLILALRLALTAVKEMRARLVNPPVAPQAFIDMFARQGLPQTVAILREHVALI
jgi:predicted nucleic acid-binding protein